MVELNEMLLTYLPFEDDGFARTTVPMNVATFSASFSAENEHLPTAA
jgi:hypothetical protein